MKTTLTYPSCPVIMVVVLSMNSNLPNLSVQLAPSHSRGLALANPVMTASGCFGYGTEYSELVDIQRLGAIVCKGTTIRSKDGNLQPRLVETPCGLLNSVGLENIGVDAVIKDKASIWATWQIPVIVNIVGETVDEYVQVATKLEGVAGISGIELNISCPNVAAGGMEFGVSSRLASEVTSAVKAATSLPVIVKLTPNVTDIEEIALAVEKAGADAICLINTVKGMAIDINKGEPSLKDIAGGLSGPAIKPIALFLVYKVARVIHIPVIGCGGIACAADALEFIMAGASAVQIGTANFFDPHCTISILEGINRFMEDKDIRSLTDIIGVAIG